VKLMNIMEFLKSRNGMITIGIAVIVILILALMFTGMIKL